MEWNKYHSYRVFDEFIETFILGKHSYITNHSHILDLNSGLSEIKKRFIDNYDNSISNYEDKLVKQFSSASLNAKIVYSNIEYLWCMPVDNISPKTKRQYSERWFTKSEVNKGELFFFNGNHAAANPGQWNNQNKFYEISSIVRLITLLLDKPAINNQQDVKSALEELCYEAIYDPNALNDSFNIKNKCATHNMILHLANPDKYEVIVSDTDKDKILDVFGYSLADEHERGDREQRIKQIKTNLYDQYAANADSNDKQRWFFYMRDVLSLWKKKASKQDRKETSIRLEIQTEESSFDLEGGKVSVNGYRIIRSSKLVREAKARDNYTCRACSFNYKNEIVQAHHLDPISERKYPQKTTASDLITLCPNCHYLAHYLLRLKGGDKYKKDGSLVEKLKTINQTNHEETIAEDDLERIEDILEAFLEAERCEEQYSITKNPIYVWKAFHILTQEKQDIPDWINGYFFEASYRLLDATDNHSYTPANLNKITGIEKQSYFTSFKKHEDKIQFIDEINMLKEAFQANWNADISDDELILDVAEKARVSYRTLYDFFYKIKKIKKKVL